MALEKEKKVLITICETLIKQRMEAAEKAMKEAQEASNSEEKSSAGDKYETSRAMGQISRNLNAQQVAEALKELALLQQMAKMPPLSTIQNGSLIETDGPWFFIALGLGKIAWNGKDVYVINPIAPLAKNLMALKTNDTIAFQDNQYTIRNVG